MCDAMKYGETMPQTNRQARHSYANMLRYLTKFIYSSNISFSLMQDSNFQHWLGFMLEHYKKVGILPTLSSGDNLSNGVFACEYNQLFKLVNIYVFASIFLFCVLKIIINTKAQIINVSK